MYSVLRTNKIGRKTCSRSLTNVQMSERDVGYVVTYSVVLAAATSAILGCVVLNGW